MAFISVDFEVIMIKKKTKAKKNMAANIEQDSMFLSHWGSFEGNKETKKS